MLRVKHVGGEDVDLMAERSETNRVVGHHPRRAAVRPRGGEVGRDLEDPHGVSQAPTRSATSDR